MQTLVKFNKCQNWGETSTMWLCFFDPSLIWVNYLSTVSQNLKHKRFEKSKIGVWGALLYRTLNVKSITLIFIIRLRSKPICFDLKQQSSFRETSRNWLLGTVLIMMLNFWYHHQQFEKSCVPIQPWHIHTAKLPVIHSVDQTIFTNSIWICINWKHFVKPCWWSNKSFEEKADWPLIFQWKGM